MEGGRTLPPRGARGGSCRPRPLLDGRGPRASSQPSTGRSPRAAPNCASAGSRPALGARVVVDPLTHRLERGWASLVGDVLKWSGTARTVGRDRRFGRPDSRGLPGGSPRTIDRSPILRPCRNFNGDQYVVPGFAGAGPPHHPNLSGSPSARDRARGDRLPGPNARRVGTGPSPSMAATSVAHRVLHPDSSSRDRHRGLEPSIARSGPSAPEFPGPGRPSRVGPCRMDRSVTARQTPSGGHSTSTGRSRHGPVRHLPIEHPSPERVHLPHHGRAAARRPRAAPSRSYVDTPASSKVAISRRVAHAPR